MYKIFNRSYKVKNRENGSSKNVSMYRGAYKVINV